MSQLYEVIYTHNEKAALNKFELIAYRSKDDALKALNGKTFWPPRKAANDVGFPSNDKREGLMQYLRQFVMSSLKLPEVKAPKIPQWRLRGSQADAFPEVAELLPKKKMS